MPTTMLIPLHDPAPADPSQVGGKAHSLMRLAAAGLPVPAGATLTCAFFEPWRAALAALASRDNVRACARRLPFDRRQREALAALPALVGDGPEMRLAVRSSVVGEDAADASFAGVYETRLGVRHADLETALRECFAASVDPRVDAYRRERGVDGAAPSVAILVQRQLDSDVAGVGFSLNPVTNDYDEAVFAAAWGLGTVVVDGRVVPDEYVVDKAAGRLLAERRGDKRVAARVAAAGVVEAAEPRAGERALTDAQLAELTALVRAVEALYATPVDIEWAYAGGRLHVLQARPITTWVPLPDAMLTRPGERRRLYLDAALSKGMTTNTAFSPLGLDQMQRALGGLVANWLGAAPRAAAPDALIFFDGGRMYMNLGDLLRFASPAQLAKGHASTDTLTAAILAGVDRARYRAAARPRWLRASLLWRAPRALWRVRGLFGFVLLALFRPDAAHRAYVRTSAALVDALRARLDDERALDELQRDMTAAMVPAFGVLMGAVLLGAVHPRLALGRAGRFPAELLAPLTRGSRDNVTVDMSLALQRLARSLDADAVADPARLAQRVADRELPEPFLAELDRFFATYGWRGPDEMDVASPRYADAPALLAGQLAALRDGVDLGAAHARHAEERAAAYAAIAARLGPVRRWLLGRVRRLHESFAGARDTPKYVNVLCNFVIRTRALRAGARLAAAGRLDEADHVFDLTFDDLAAAAADPALDLRARRAANTRFLRRVRAQVRTFPPVIDSRGRILRAAVPDAGPGVLRGMPVSAGVARGPARILRTADAARVEVGDVLVAYTTDPGWTPIFVNAAAIVLEVGGVLQHGAVVAREFGKPCVVGIADVVATLADGELVEVDGAAGTLTRLAAAARTIEQGCDDASRRST
jgi:pyruvate,water dikinase